MYLLTESHLACHTYPEHGVATFNLHCCRARPRWAWEAVLQQALGATRVSVRELRRGGEP
jgi:S-adenosylmethionine decarboxylase